jgi:hypothetical protein
LSARTMSDCLNVAGVRDMDSLAQKKACQGGDPGQAGFRQSFG